MSNLNLWITLSQANGIGPANLNLIHETLSSLNLSIYDLFSLTAKEIQEEFNFNEKLSNSIESIKQNIEDNEKIYLKLIDNNIEIIPFFSEKYPKKLKINLEKNAPPFLYVFGNSEILSQKSVAILGDKDVSERGRAITLNSSIDLSKHKITVISGMASGVGTLAHHSALINEGTTIAMLPYGIFHLKIPEIIKESLKPEQIAFVSPFPPKTEANKFNAFIRNKIICAMSEAVFIVEAPEEGGIFEAAKSAKKLDIPLFAVQYNEYPKNAIGNKIIIEKFKANPIRGKIEEDILKPNIDKIISVAKFS